MRSLPRQLGLILMGGCIALSGGCLPAGDPPPRQSNMLLGLGDDYPSWLLAQRYPLDGTCARLWRGEERDSYKAKALELKCDGFADELARDAGRWFGFDVEATHVKHPQLSIAFQRLVVARGNCRQAVMASEMNRQERNEALEDCG